MLGRRTIPMHLPGEQSETEVFGIWLMGLAQSEDVIVGRGHADGLAPSTAVGYSLGAPCDLPCHDARAPCDVSTLKTRWWMVDAKRAVRSMPETAWVGLCHG